MSTSAIRLRRRPGAWRDVLRGYRVLIDGENVGLIRLGQVREFSVTPGMHSIRLKIDWCSSPELSVNIRAGDTIGFVCAPGGSPLRLWDLVVNTGKYIHLAQDAG
jgi:hypothetical protein